MFENPRRGRQAKTFTTTVPKILDQIVFQTDIFRKLPLGAPDLYCRLAYSYKIVISRAALIENNRVDELSVGI